jgi:general L-amino acid transport system permease protein
MQIKVSVHKHATSNRAKIYQVLMLGLIFLTLGLIVYNTLTNMHQRGIQGGFGFLLDPAGFDISESWIPFESSNSYAMAFAVGLVNTLRVCALSIITCTALGILLGLGRISPNPLIRFGCQVYVEIFRNIPLLIQLLIWYVLIVESLPDTQSPIHFYFWDYHFYLSKEGLSVPWFTSEPGKLFQSASFVDGNLSGGATLSPEFMALYTGLSLYTSAFASEVVRAGLLSVDKGQIEAGLSLGLKRWQITLLIILPKALRVIIPPMANQYLNLIKNSSLAVAIGYPDLVNISNTTLNQTGHAVECVLIIMLIYLAISLITSNLMNAYNKRVMLRG